MGLAMTTNSNRLGTLRDILARLRDETYQKIVAFRRDQGEEVMTSPGDEMDVARSTSDVETHASLIERAEDRLRLIDQALARVDNGTYGTCAECGEDIPVERPEGTALRAAMRRLPREARPQPRSMGRRRHHRALQSDLDASRGHGGRRSQAEQLRGDGGCGRACRGSLRADRRADGRGTEAPTRASAQE